MSRLLLVLAVLVGCKKAVPVPEPSVAAETDPLLPMDPGVRHGTFENGMKWFIEENARPENRVVFRLAVNAGSILEDDDQQGLAHFVEHMAFNGTESFPGNSLISFLESTGTRFGPHLNAHTSFEETVYKLTVPTDDPKAYDTAFKVVGEWACCLTMDPDEMEKERGVVLEEWRTRLGAQSRITDATLPVSYFGSRYPERLPIGTEQSLKTFKPEAATRFYKDWYHPENMAIIVVGDVNSDEVLARLEAQFGSIPAAQTPRERIEFDIPAHSETLFAIHADPEVSRTSVSVLSKFDDPQMRTFGEYRETLIEAVGTLIFNQRLAAIAQAPGAPFLGASGGSSRMTPTEGSHRVGALAHEGRVEDALEAVLVEVKRLQTHGVLPEEVARAKAAVVEGYTAMLKELENTESAEHADEIVRHFLQGETMPGTEVEVKITLDEVPNFTVEELNAWAKTFLPTDSRVVTVVMPDGGATPPTDTDLRETLTAVSKREPAAPEPEVGIEVLVSAAPTQGAVVREDEQFLSKLGFKGLVLANGATVWSKKTAVKADEVQFRGWRRGGTESLPDEVWRAARAAGSIRTASGLGDYDATQLGRYLTDKTVRISPYIGAREAGFSGSASPDDLETALQLLHLDFTAPRFTTEGLAVTRERRRASIENRLKDPRTHFSDAWTQQLWPDDPRRDPMTLEDLDALSVEASAAVWADRFRDPSDFTFVFVGALPENFESLVTTWIGGIPEAEASHTRSDRGFHRKKGALSRTVEQGVEQKAIYRTEFWGELETYDWETRARLSSMSDVLSVLLRERLREELGGVYGVSVRSNSWDFPYKGYSVRIEYSCDPDRVDELETAMEAVIEDAKRAIDPKYVQQEIAKNREAREEALNENGFWLGAFTSALQHEEDPHAILQFDSRNEAHTAASLSAAAKAWLSDKGRATVRLLPASE